MIREEIIGDARLILGDCRDILPTLGKVDAVVTDPPYGMDWNTDTMRFSGGKSPLVRRGLKRASNNGNGHSRVIGDKIPFDPSPWLRWPCVLWGSNHYSSSLPLGKTLVWVKRHPELFGSFLSDCEIAWASGGHGCYAFYKQFPPPIRAIEGGGDPSFPTTIHPTQKSIGLMAWCIGFFPDAETILDPFMGSGTTGVACAKLGRKFIGIEIEQKYFDIACRRIEETYRQPDMLIEAARPAVQECLDI